MGKAAKIFLLLALLVSLGGFTLSILTAQQAGLSFEELTQIIRHNMKQLNMDIVMSEYSEIRESVAIQPEGGVSRLTIRSTFPELVVRPGDSFAVNFYGDVSNELEELLTWKQTNGELTLQIASVHNDNPSATGLVAEIILPDQDFSRIRITTVSGSVQASGLAAGQLEISSRSGAVHIVDSALGQLSIESESGEQSVMDDRSLELELVSESGGIEVMASGLAGAVESASGRIRLTWLEAAGDLDVRTVSGSQEFFFRGNDLAYDLKSITGQVRVVRQDDEAAASGRIGRGGPKLHARTASGSIAFRLVEPAAAEKN